MNVDVNSSGTIPVVQRDSNISLYDHQKEAYKELSDWSRRQEEEPAGLLVLPTGGGKTLTATYWLMQNVLSRGKKILWIAHRYSLLEQAYHSFELVCCRNISMGGKSSYSYRIISGIHNSAYSIRPDDDILIASKASLSIKKAPFRAWLEKNRDNFYFIIDEAHHAPAKGYRDLIRDMRQYGGRFFMLGLTATPFRTPEEEKGWMKKVFPDDILYRTSISDLTTKGILSKAKFDRIPTNIDMRKWFERNNATAVYNRIISEKKFDIDGVGKDAKLAASLIAENHERNMLIVETYKKDSSKYGKTLVFALNRAMAKLLYKYFKAANIRANYVISGRTDGQDNEAIIKDFKADKLDVLINVNIVTEGVDVPNVKTVFLTRPTKSKILMTQMIGRGLRGQKVGGTEVTYIVDFLDKWRDELVAWVIPEKLYEEEGPVGSWATLPPVIDSTGVKYTPTEEELSDWEILHTISEGKLTEFIQLANSRFDLSLFEQFSLIERVPLGYYYFDYEITGDDGEGETKTCSVMVYDCMKAKFDELIDWLDNRSDKKFFDIEAMADEIDEKFFGEREELLGYSKENICDLLRFYSQNENDSPKFIEFAKRAEYDISALVQHVADATYIEDEWNRSDGKWKNFFGEQNKMAFLAAITAEVAKSAGLLKKPTNALTAEEIQTAEKMPLDVLVTRHSDIYEKIRDTVYESARENGEYVDSQSGRRSKSRLDFEIGYKTPLNAGGKTETANLRLVYMGASQYLPNTTWEDMPLSNIEHKDPAQYKRICDAVYRYYQFRNGDYYDERNNQRSDNRFDFEIGYKVPLNAGGKTVPANLYLVYKKSNLDSTAIILPPPMIIPPVVNFKTIDEMIKRLEDEIGWNKLPVKDEIVAALSKLKAQAQQNRDAVAMKQVGIYYGRIHEHDEAGRCYALAKSFQVKPPPPIITPPVKTYGEPIPGTNLTWRLDNGTLLISGTGKMKDWDNEKNLAPWYRQRETVEKIVIKDGVTSISDNAFEACHSLTSIVIPDSVMSIGEWAFDNCGSLTNVVIPHSVKFIGECAFVWCESLRSIALPDNVTMDNAVFVGCTSLKKIDQPSKVIFCDNLFVYEKKSEGLKINSFIGTLGVSVAVIPDSVTAISDFAFSFCDSLKEIVIPNSVTSIGDCAFQGCDLLTNATLSPSVKKIGYTIFSDCKKLQNIRYKRGLNGVEKLREGNNARLIPY